MRGVAFSAYVIFFLKDRVVGIALLLKIHGRGKACRTTADDTDFFVQISHFLLLFSSLARETWRGIRVSVS